jgi:hypothetical protein
VPHHPEFDGEKSVASPLILATRYAPMITGAIIAVLFLLAGIVTFLYMQKGKM